MKNATIMNRWWTILGICLTHALLALHAGATEPRACVLLTNGNVLFGDAVPLGETITIQQANDSQMRIPRNRVVDWAESLPELYAKLRADRIPGDLRRIQSDVRWCLRYGLVRQAAQDVLIANELAPSDATTQQLLRLVAHEMRKQQPSTPKLDQPVRQVSHETVGGFALPAVPKAESPPPPQIKSIVHDKPVPTDPELFQSLRESAVEEESAHRFTTRVQPIFLNRCAGCHSESAPQKNNFELIMPRTAKWAPKRAGQKNLGAVMKYVNRTDPLSSLIRARAIDGHGGRRKSLNDPSGAMLKNLDAWLLGLRSTGRTVEDQSADPALRPIEPPPLEPWGSDPPQTAAVPEWPPTEETNSALADRPRPRRIPQVENPFDPAIFNRRFHGIDSNALGDGP